ncbi:calmodulin, putative [Plasmodium ovale]|uniref:Calmodulin n=1 Tax=Plasmodium ovale TaxID=36330 RepID=A0A1D3TG69_PLAOA|nr:calmodulin, putative [Plasmodium ovale]
MRINLPEDKIELIRRNFNLIDSNEDKKIDEEEFRTLIRLLGQTRKEKEIDEIITQHFEDDNEEDEVNKNNEAENEIKKEEGKNESKNFFKKNTTKNIPNHERIKNLIAKLNNFKEDNKKKKDTNSLGTKEEINSELKKKKHINFDTFMKIFINMYTEPISLNELIKSFEILDNEKCGYIDEDKLRYILMNCDEKLTDEDHKLFFNSLNLKDKGKIDYVLLSKKLKNMSIEGGE